LEPLIGKIRNCDNLQFLVHFTDELVNELLTITQVTALDKMFEFASAETAVGRRELEGPEKVGSLLEVRADSVDLMDKILDGDDSILAQVLLNKLVIGQGDSLAINLSVATLVDQLTDGLEVWFTVCNPWLNDTEHFSSGLGKANEDTVVDLEETEELKDLARLGGDLVDTLDTNNKDKLRLSRDIKAAVPLGFTSKADFLTLCLTVFLYVLLRTLEDNFALGLDVLLSCLSSRGALLSSLLLSLALLKKSFWDKDLVGGGDGSVRHCGDFRRRRSG
jgi:hypothetical protein